MPKVILLINVLIFKENFINGIFEESQKVTFYVIVDKAISYPISYGISPFTSPGGPGVTSSLANILSSPEVADSAVITRYFRVRELRCPGGSLIWQIF